MLTEKTPCLRRPRNSCDAAGRQGWIQKRWLGGDSTVAAAILDKAVANQTTRQADYEAARAAQEAERAFRDSLHTVRAVCETEKAVAAEVIVELGGCETPRLVWFPKSRIGGQFPLVIVPGWMIREKECEECEGYRGSSYYERHRYCKGEPVYLARGVEIIMPEPPAVA